MYKPDIKKRVVQLRKKGKTYGEILKNIGLNIPKSTLSDWCNGILLSQLQKRRIQLNMLKKSENGRQIAWAVLKERRLQYLKSVENRVKKLPDYLHNKSIAKLAAAMLYLGEGAKTRKGSLSLGNSDPNIIKLFLHLLRYAYNIDESKFRCTVQCRADQKTVELEKFWSKITNISSRQFYKTRIDLRTFGKKSKKPDYKGVCKIEYFSADLFLELMKIGELICKVGP